MKSSNVFISAILLGMITFTSCKSVYEPNLVHMPLMQNKSELAISVDGKNLQVAYAVTDHIALMANGFYTQKPANNEVGEQGGAGALGEVGIGYFTSLSDGFIFETYGGVGAGNAYLINKISDPNNANNILDQTFDASAVKYFLQPNIGYKTRYFDAGFGTRLSIIDYSNPSLSNYTAQQVNDDGLGAVGSTTFYFIEPAFTIRGGYKFAKVQLQYVRSIKLNNDALNYGDDQLSLGLFFNLNNNLFSSK